MWRVRRSSAKKMVCVVTSLGLQRHFTKLRVARIALRYLTSPNAVSYNASPNGPSPHAIGRGAPPCQRPSLPHPPCQRPLLPYPPCQCPRSQIPLANFPSLLATVPNLFAPCISFLCAHRFDTFSLAVSAPPALLKSAAYIFICASISMLILSKFIYIINAYFIKPIFLLSPIPRAVMIPPVFSPRHIR